MGTAAASDTTVSEAVADPGWRGGRPAPGREALAAEVHRLTAAAAAALEREDAARAQQTAASAVRLARRLGAPALEGEARAIYGRSLGYGGSLRTGLAQLDRAERLLEGPALGTALVHRSALLYKMGRPAAAVDACRRALALLPEEADRDRARALNNVGISQLYLGDLVEAHRSLAEAERLHRLGQRPAQAAQSRANRAMVSARLGDLAGALRGFDEAERELRERGLFEGQNQVAKADVLLDAGLLRDVRRELPAVVDALDASGMAVDAAEGQLYLALALVGLGDPTAAQAARAARRRFRAVGAPGWEAMAALVEVRARWAGGDTSADALAAAKRTVAALGRRDLRPYEPEAQLLCAQLAEAANRFGDARCRFASVAAGRAGGTVRQRVLGWEALARLRLLDGNRAGALRAAGAGLRVIERHRDAIGAADLRAGASSQGVELASLGLRLALERREPRAVLRWAERWRAGALYRRPVLPPADPVLAQLLADLRQAAVTVRVEAAAGRTRPHLEQEMARLELAVGARVRTTAMASAPAGLPAAAGALDIDELQAALGPRALVELVDCGGRLEAVILDDRRCTVRLLGRSDDGADLAAATLFALRKLARLPASSRAARGALADVSARLGAQRAWLVEPILPLVADRELVVVPTGRLHAVPWQLLVGGARAVAVAPSAALWLRAARTTYGPGPVVAVAGPDLQGAEGEVEAVCRHHPSATALTGAGATVKAVTAAIDGAALVHLAAHGDVRQDNPLFSSFRLVDGPQTVYDLQCLDGAPGLVVLSACNSALSEVDAGDELLGLVASLLSLGTRSAIAAVLPIPDLATVALMDRLHQRLAAGDPPARALATTVAEVDGDDSVAVAAAAAFVCLGAS